MYPPLCGPDKGRAEAVVAERAEADVEELQVAGRGLRGGQALAQRGRREEVLSRHWQIANLVTFPDFRTSVWSSYGNFRDFSS